MIREKKTYSGPLLEADFYPVFSDGRKAPSRAAKTKPSTDAQQKYNETQAIKKTIRLINANFNQTDYWTHPTYETGKAPQSREQAKKDIDNYIRRVKARREKEEFILTADLKAARDAARKLPDNKFLQSSVKELKMKLKKVKEPFRYYCAIEKQTYKTGKLAGLINWHFHLFMTGGLDNKLLERMWTNGIHTNCNNFQPERFGPEAAALYMSKDPQGAKRFSYSKNLKKPKTPKPIDGRMTRKWVECIATMRVDDRVYWENKYRGYRFLRCFSRYNQYNGYWYVSAIMYKAEDHPPEWKTNEWITTDF